MEVKPSRRSRIGRWLHSISYRKFQLNIRCVYTCPQASRPVCDPLRCENCKIANVYFGLEAAVRCNPYERSLWALRGLLMHGVGQRIFPLVTSRHRVSRVWNSVLVCGCSRRLCSTSRSDQRPGVSARVSNQMSERIQWQSFRVGGWPNNVALTGPKRCGSIAARQRTNR
jgi:hypothetical protein